MSTTQTVRKVRKAPPVPVQAAQAPAQAAKAAQPAQAPAQAAEAPAAPAALPARRVPLGVYLTRSREIAIAIRHNDTGIWYLTTAAGHVRCEHRSDERFLREFPFQLAGYPILRAIRKFNENGMPRDEHTQKIIKRLLESL
jgi:hypothetical protein